MIKYLMGSIFMMNVLPLQAAGLPSIPEQQDSFRVRSSRPIGLMSKRYYRGCRHHVRKSYAEQPEERYASLAALYNQLEAMYSKSNKLNDELLKKNVTLKRIAFDRNPYYEIENQTVPGFGNIIISRKSAVAMTTTATATTTCTIFTQLNNL